MSRRLAHNRRLRSAATLASAYAAEPLERRLLLAVSLSMSGSQSIANLGLINVSNDGTFGQSEMIMEVNPANPLQIAGFAHRVGNFNVIDVYHSEDGGTTWARRGISDGTVGDNDGTGAGFRFDPALVYDRFGNLYVAYGNNAGGSTRVIVARSTNNGASFTQFRILATTANIGTLAGNDKWHLATGTDGFGGEAIYMTWTQNVTEVGGTDQRIVVDASNNGGANWLGPLTINDGSIGGRDPSNLFADPAIGPAGQVYIAWHDIDGNRILFDRDLDGCFNNTLGFGGDIVARNLVNNSLFANTMPATPERGVYTAPSIDVDRSGGAFNGRIYLTFVERFSGNDTDLRLANSINQGTSWTTNSVETATSTDFEPWVDVDQHSGSVHVIYYSTRDDGAGADDVKPFARTSVDGGITFPNLAALTTQTSNEAGGYAGDYLEYIGLAVHDGTGHGFWASRYAGGGTDLDAFTTTFGFISSTLTNILTIRGDDAGPATSDTITLRTAAANNNYLEVFVNGARQYTGLWLTLDRITIDGGGGSDTINIEDQRSWVSTTVNPTGFSTDTINLGKAGIGLQNIAGNITLWNQPSFNIININDTGSAVPRNWTLDAFTPGGDSEHGRITGLAPATITFRYADTTALNIVTGSGVDTGTVRAVRDPTHINTAGSGDIVNVGDPAVGVQNITAQLTIENNPSFTTLNIDDAGDATARTITMDIVAGFTHITGLAPATIRYDNIDISSVTVRTGSGADTFNVLRSSEVTTLNSSGGGDVVNVGNASTGLQEITAQLTIENDPSFTTLTLDDGANTASRTVTVDVIGNYTHVSGFAPALIRFDNVDINTVTYRSGTDADTFAVLRSSETSTFTSTNGGDAITIGNGTNGMQSVFGGITIINPPSFTTLTLDDSADATGRTVTLDTFLSAGFNHGRVTGLAPAVIDYRLADIASPITINAGSGSDTFNVTTTPASRTLRLNTGDGADTVNVNNTGAASAMLLNGGGNTDTFNISETAIDGPVTIVPSSGDDTVDVNGDGAGFAAAVFDATQRVGLLSVRNGGLATLTSGGAKVLTITSLNISGSGQVNLSDNDMIVDYTGGSPIGNIQTYLTSGYAGGAWTGPGLTSSAAAASTSTALGYAESTDIFSVFPAVFSGQSVDNTAVLIKYTFYGDATLDGTVNLQDFNRLASNFGQSPRRWSQGNFNFDQTVNLQDFNRLATNFGATGLGPDAGGSEDEELPPIEELQRRLAPPQDETESPPTPGGVI